MRLPLRFVPGARRFLLLAAPVTLAIAIVVAAYLFRSFAPAASSAPPVRDPVLQVPADPGLLVHVVGAVENPGLYRLPRGDRVFDAIAAAGGLSADADTSKLPDYAGRLRDGEQIKVAFAKTSSGTVIARVNLNQATLEELESTSGFAQECIDYRTNFGGFQNTRELVEILGMSESDYVVARKFVTL